MTKEETKKLVEVMQAYINGEEIETKDKGNMWHTVTPDWLPDREYRVKPKSIFRPFKNIQECQEEMQRHQPFGWIRAANKYLYSIREVKDDGCIFGDGNGASFSALFQYKTFLDGTPFGIKVK